MQREGTVLRVVSINSVQVAFSIETLGSNDSRDLAINTKAF